MSDFYSDMSTTANELIAEYGRDVTYKHYATLTYIDPLRKYKGYNKSPGSASEKNVKAIQDEFSRNDMENTTISIGDYKLTVSASSLGFVPKLEDEISDGSKDLTIKHIEETKPGDTALTYTFWVKEK